MIFVTVGSQKQNFNRLFDYINELHLKEKIIVQKGSSDYLFNDKIECYDYLSLDEMDRVLKKANLIITHGGGGTIFKALELDKKIIVVPRLAKYKEHINNHQLELAEFLEKNNYCLIAKNKQEFDAAIKKIESTKFTKYVSHTDKFIKQLEKEINKL